MGRVLIVNMKPHVLRLTERVRLMCLLNALPRWLALCLAGTFVVPLNPCANSGGAVTLVPSSFRVCSSCIGQIVALVLAVFVFNSEERLPPQSSAYQAAFFQ